MDRPEEPPRLRGLQVPGYPEPIPLTGDELSLGRLTENDVCLPGDVFPSVSQRHARIERREDGLWIEDLGSKNGTFVNGQKIERERISPGDILQLGSIGPKFVVLGGSALAETMFVDPQKVGIDGLRASKLTDTAVGGIRAALGVPENVSVEDLVTRRSRGNLVRGAVALVLVAAALILWGRRLSDESHREGQRVESAVVDLNKKLLKDREQREIQLAQQRRVFEERLREMEEEKTRLEQDRTTLQDRIQRLESEDSSSAGRIADLRQQLEETRVELDRAQSELKMMDPIDLEQARLADVRRVRESIVLLEAKLTLRDKDTGKILYVDDASGFPVPNFEDRGEPMELESSGSGFCVAEDGWIITNAHVVKTPEEQPVSFSGESSIQMVMEIEAVFSNTSQRHRATVIKVADEGSDDLALVKIAPFDGMPYLDGFDLSSPLPEPGTDVYLFGFPLGNFALQQGETVIASTFRGILSRQVGGRFQVDAGVHPGNSGGPVTDASGQVIGVVFSVQSMPDQSAVYTIGYAIPIAEASKIWPPPEAPQ